MPGRPAPQMIPARSEIPDAADPDYAGFIRRPVCPPAGKIYSARPAEKAKGLSVGPAVRIRPFPGRSLSHVYRPSRLSFEVIKGLYPDSGDSSGRPFKTIDPGEIIGPPLLVLAGSANRYPYIPDDCPMEQITRNSKLKVA